MSDDENEGTEGESSEQDQSQSPEQQEQQGPAEDEDVEIESEQYWTEESLDVSYDELVQAGWEPPPDAGNDEPNPDQPVA
jgi:hypothetical protein